VRRVLARSFERFGLTPVLCGDGAEALELVTAEPARFQLVVLDLTMPRLRGDEALIAMRRLRPDIPALVLSGYLEEEIRERLKDTEKVAMLHKPFTLRDLADLLWQVAGPTDTGAAAP